MSNSIFRKDGTAQGVAKQRLIETLAKPNKRVIYDPYAKNFVLGASIIKLMGHKLNVWLGEKIVPGMHEHLISRTRFIDDLIENSASMGIEQYVILGAGYDSRAHRLKLPNNLKIFEVDQPEVQEKKISKLSKKFEGLQEINSSLNRNISTSPVRIASSGSLTPSSLSNGILFIGLVAILFFIMLK